MTLNNLALLQDKKNETEKAEKNYQEALKIRRELAKETPAVYEIDLAKMIIMGIHLFKKDKTNFQEAKDILQKYPHIPLAQSLIKIVKSLE